MWDKADCPGVGTILCTISFWQCNKDGLRKSSDIIPVLYIRLISLVISCIPVSPNVFMNSAGILSIPVALPFDSLSIAVEWVWKRLWGCLKVVEKSLILFPWKQWPPWFYRILHVYKLFTIQCTWHCVVVLESCVQYFAFSQVQAAVNGFAEEYFAWRWWLCCTYW